MATFSVFGTTAVLLTTEQSALPRAREIADLELAAVDEACSRFRSDSELSILNAARGALTTVSELFAELIEQALRAAELTGGAVDLTVGQALAAAGYDRDFGELSGSRSLPAARPAAVPGWRSVQLDRDARQVRLANGAELDLGSVAKAWAADRCATQIA